MYAIRSYYDTCPGIDRLLFSQPQQPEGRDHRRAGQGGTETMSKTLTAYEGIVGPSAITQLYRLGKKLKGRRIVHVNSTREGGGVAEILEWMVPLMRDVGLDASWESYNFV